MNKEDKKIAPKYYIYLGVLLFSLIAIIIVVLVANSITNQVDYINNGYVEPYQAPEIVGVKKWFNSEPISIEELKGKVVLVDFWTYSCINCVRTIPYIQSWYDKYNEDGFEVIGVHSPEFAFERIPQNVQNAIDEYNITYPVAMDNDFETWNAYNNRFWPSHYFINRDGNIVYEHFGEGDYDKTERVIQDLLGIEEQLLENADEDPPIDQRQTPEIYLGYQRMRGFRNSDQILENRVQNYDYTTNLLRNEWSLGGDWLIEDQSNISRENGAKLALNFSGKTVYLVMGSISSGNVEVTFNRQKVNLGQEINDRGILEVSEYKLYEIIRSEEFIENGILELEFDKGIEIHAFTFGS